MSVYFITAREVGRVKIGCAYEPFRRMATMQIGCPVELVLEATYEGFHKEERELHKRFAGDRLHGEWFTLTTEIEALISDNRVGAAPSQKEIKALRKAWRESRRDDATPYNDNDLRRYFVAMAEMRADRERLTG